MKKIEDLEKYLNTKASKKWCYVGGYACLKWQLAYPTGAPIATDDLDIQIELDAYEAVLSGIEKSIFPEKTKALEGYKVQFLSCRGLPPHETLGDSNVATIDQLILTYESVSAGSGITAAFAGNKAKPGTSASAEKVENRQRRVAILKEIKKNK